MGKIKTGDKVKKMIPPLCLCYAVMMQQRNHELSLVQRINTILMSEGKATKKVWFAEL